MLASTVNARCQTQSGEKNSCCNAAMLRASGRPPRAASQAQPYRTMLSSLLVLGQPQQQRHGQHRMTVRQSQKLWHSLQGRQQTSLKQPMVR